MKIEFSGTTLSSNKQIGQEAVEIIINNESDFETLTSLTARAIYGALKWIDVQADDNFKIWTGTHCKPQVTAFLDILPRDRSCIRVTNSELASHLAEVTDIPVRLLITEEDFESDVPTYANENGFEVMLSLEKDFSITGSDEVFLVTPEMIMAQKAAIAAEQLGGEICPTAATGKPCCYCKACSESRPIISYHLENDSVEE